MPGRCLGIVGIRKPDKDLRQDKEGKYQVRAQLQEVFGSQKSLKKKKTPKEWAMECPCRWSRGWQRGKGGEKRIVHLENLKSCLDLCLVQDENRGDTGEKQENRDINIRVTLYKQNFNIIKNAQQYTLFFLDSSILSVSAQCRRQKQGQVLEAKMGLI